MKVAPRNKLDLIQVSCTCGCGRRLNIYDYRYNGVKEKNQFIQIAGVTGSVAEWKKVFSNLLKKV